MSAPRTPETVTRDIEREREQLALAVSHLRSDLRAATDIRAVVKAKLPLLAAVAGLAAIRRQEAARSLEPDRSLAQPAELACDLALAVEERAGQRAGPGGERRQAPSVGSW